MYCKNCGNQIDDDSVICIHCGANTGKSAKSATTTTTTVNVTAAAPTHTEPVLQNNTMALVGFILSFFIPIAGLICSIMGLKKVSEGYDKKGLAIAGIVLSALAMVFNIIIFIIYGAYIIALLQNSLYTALLI